MTPGARNEDSSSDKDCLLQYQDLVICSTLHTGAFTKSLPDRCATSALQRFPPAPPCCGLWVSLIATWEVLWGGPNTGALKVAAFNGIHPHPPTVDSRQPYLCSVPSLNPLFQLPVPHLSHRE